MDSQILNKLDSIEKKLNMILVRLENCEKSCTKMDNHISFVEETYSTLRSPLDYIRSVIDSITRTQTEELPNLPLEYNS